MGGLTTADLVLRHRKVGLDSSLFIYLIDDIAPWAERVAELLTAVDARAISAVMSAIGMTEVLSGLPVMATSDSLSGITTISARFLA